MTPTTAPPARRAALVFIFVTVLIDILAFGLIIPVLPHLVEQFVGGDTRTAAWWVGIFGVTFAAIQVSGPMRTGPLMMPWSLIGSSMLSILWSKSQT